MDETNEKPCRVYHGVAGVMPTVKDIKFDGMACDCGKIRFKAIACGCPDMPEGKQLISEQNPDYVPKE